MTADLDARINEIVAEYRLDAEQATENDALRRLAKALARTEAQTTPDRLDDVWAAVEAALPEGWAFIDITMYPAAADGPPKSFARVRLRNVTARDGSTPEAHGSGATLVEALRDLAAALTPPPAENEQ